MLGGGGSTVRWVVQVIKWGGIFGKSFEAAPVKKKVSNATSPDLSNSQFSTPTMSRKRNEWLEADLDDEEDHHNSDDQEEGRGQSLAKRSNKRRKIDSDQESEDEDIQPEQEDQEAQEEPLNDIDGPIESTVVDGTLEPKQKKSKVEKKLAKVRDVASRSGVIYISRVPPFMKPHTLKNLLLPYATSGIGRIFLTPEDHDQRQNRIRGGGNKKKSFTDGWVEFTSKKEAKIIVETLNARTIGGKKGGYYVDDVWNLKYLKGFKWRHLTEQIANENAERSARMRAEGSSSRREMNEFLKNVDYSKIEATRQQKREKAAHTSGVIQKNSNYDSGKSFRQNKPVTPKDKKVDNAPTEDVQRVLSKIF
jgi:ESF2/ABP1 family protein